MNDSTYKDDFKEKAKVELDLDDLENVAGGNDPRGRIEWCVDCGATFYAAEGHDCPDR